MRAAKPTLWEGERLTFEHAIQLTIDSLNSYGPMYRHWAIAYSGGKDSSTVVTLVAHLIATSAILPPESLTVLYADTRMELPPLQAAALTILAELEQRGIQTQVVVPSLDDRYFVYMFGRGVPPPKNRRFRWCTPQLKVEPMNAALAVLHRQHGEKYLLLTGVRIGESAARDQRIAISCSKDGAECGQGWFQVETPESVADVLAPCLHWRVCHIWDWLTFHAPSYGFPTQVIAEVYGGDEKEEINARTGCVGCNLTSKDVALEALLRLPQWAYLAPLTMETRRYGLAQVLDIQKRVNTVAQQEGRPCIDLINAEEQARILALIKANTWPRKWTGDEARGDVLLPQVLADGVLQPLLEESH